MDACFRLKRRAVSGEVQDPIMGSGWGYFVKDRPYKEHLQRYADQTDVRDNQFNRLFNDEHTADLLMNRILRHQIGRENV